MIGIAWLISVSDLCSASDVVAVAGTIAVVVALVVGVSVEVPSFHSDVPGARCEFQSRRLRTPLGLPCCAIRDSDHTTRACRHAIMIDVQLTTYARYCHRPQS